MIVLKSTHDEIVSGLKKQIEKLEEERRILLSKLIGPLTENPVAEVKPEEPAVAHDTSTLSGLTRVSRNPNRIAQFVTQKLHNDQYRNSPEAAIDKLKQIAEEVRQKTLTTN